MRTRWGQHFLVSTRYARRIADQIGEQKRVLEIGPGRGALTRQLLARGASVHAVEIDPVLSAQLREELGSESLVIYNEDILEFNPDALGPTTIFVIGNIPYQITAPLIQWLLVHWRRWSGMALLVQKEVATRICATPGSHDYSSLSVMVAAFATAEVRFDIDRRHFKPRPEVDSSLVRFQMRSEPWVQEPALYAAFLKQLFSMRRKTLGNSLRHVLGGASPQPYDWIGLEKRVEAVDAASLARLFGQRRALPAASRGP